MGEVVKGTISLGLRSHVTADSCSIGVEMEGFWKVCGLWVEKLR
jgi:hypothetical protein